MKGQFSAASPARTVDRRKKQRRRINMWCWIFMIPTLILYILFQGYPILSSIFYSTLDWSGMTSSALFVGLDNFKELLQDKYFFNAVANSFKYMLMAVPLQLVISLALAYIFNSILKKGATFFRTVFFLPVITTASIVGIIMMFIFGGTGSINQFLSLFGVRGLNWLGNANTALIVVVLIGGANKWQTFLHVVFPLIIPIGGVITVLCIISSLKVFDLIQTMTNGGPFYSTDVAATFVYRTAYASSSGMPRLGYASAAAMTFGIIVVVIGTVGNVVKTAFQKKNAI